MAIEGQCNAGRRPQPEWFCEKIVSMPFLLAIVLLAQMAAPPAATPRTPIGYWQTVSDVTGRPQSVVQIYESGGRLFARVDGCWSRMVCRRPV